jgi:hypothetical protein
MRGWLRGRGGPVDYQVPHQENPAPPAAGDLVLILDMRTRQLVDAVRDVEEARQAHDNAQATLLSVRAELEDLRYRHAAAVREATWLNGERVTAIQQRDDARTELARSRSWQVALHNYGLNCGNCGGLLLRGQAVEPQPGPTNGTWNHVACPTTRGEN